MYPIIFLTQEEMKARWDKDLCYTCDEVYSFEHRCATIQLYILKDEEEGVEGEVEPEASTTLDSTAKKSVREVTEGTPPFEAVQELPDENLEVEAVGDLPEEKPSEETNVKWLEEPAIVEIKDVKEKAPTPTIEMVEKLQEASVKVLIDAKGNTQPISIIPHNQNMSTLSNPNQNIPPIQTQIFHAINQNTAAHLVANRPNPWPNKPSINTNPNRPNPWPNKLPRLTYFIRPKPWPDEPPIYKHKPRTGSNETRKIGKQTRRRKSYQFQLLVESKSDDHLQTSLMAAQVRILDFPVTIHALKGVHYQFRSTLSRATTIDSLDSDELKETRGDPGLIMANEAALVALMPIQLKEMKVVGGDRHRSRPGRLPTPFLGVVRLRSRQERQLLDSLEANRVLYRFQNRVLTVAQLRNQVIAILRHLPEFDPGDQRSPEEEESVRWSSGQFWEHERQEEGDYGFMKMIDEIWGFFLIHGCCLVKEENFGVILVETVNDLGVVLMEAGRKKEEDLCFVEEEAAIALSERRRSLIVDFHTVRFSGWSPGSKPRACVFWNIRCLVRVGQQLCLGQSDFGPILGWLLDTWITPFRIGSTAELGYLGHYCNWSPISDLGHQQIRATIAIDFPFLPYLIGPLLKTYILEDKDVFKGNGM